MSLMRTLDPGTMGGDTGWGFRIVMLGVTFGGIFVISTLIGVLTSGIEGQLDELRKGRSTGDRARAHRHPGLVGPDLHHRLRAGHRQRQSAARRHRHPAPKDKVEMEDDLRERVGPTGRTRLVCRTGSPIDMADLDLVSLGTSKSIILLSPASDNPDADVIKTMLAITNNPERRPEPYHIVAEIRRPSQPGRGAHGRAATKSKLVLVGDLVSRIIAQTCRQSGLSVIYTELLDFGGDEIYFKEEPSLVGQDLRRGASRCMRLRRSSACIPAADRRRSTHRWTPACKPATG